MAISIIASPQALTPAYNPMYFYIDSTNKTQLGFRYLIEVINNDSNEVIGRYTLKPIPTTLYGEVDIRQVIQSAMSLDFRNVKDFDPSGHQVDYKLQINESYYYNLAFSDYGFAGASTWANFGDPSVNPNGFSRTMLAQATLPTYVAGDVINIVQTPSANYRPELEGVHTVLDVFLDTGVYYTVLDLGWIGSGAASGGVSSYADGQRTVIRKITTRVQRAIKSAFSHVSFKDYGYTDFVLNGVSKLFLTNLTSNIRVSRNKPTWLNCFFDSASSYYVVFYVGAFRYRYPITDVTNKLKLVDVLPTDANITQRLNGVTWVAYVSGLDLSIVDEYQVQIQTSGGTVKSELFTVKLYDECDNFTTYDICFFDRLGSFITVPFYKGSYINQDVQRSELKVKYGGLDEGTWVYSLDEVGKKSYNVEEEIKYTVNTGILSEEECQYYRELLSTPQAYVSIDGGDLQAINIVTASMPLHLKRTQRDRKVNLVFTMAVQDEING